MTELLCDKEHVLRVCLVHVKRILITKTSRGLCYEVYLPTYLTLRDMIVEHDGATGHIVRVLPVKCEVSTLQGQVSSFSIQHRVLPTNMLPVLGRISAGSSFVIHTVFRTRKVPLG